MVDWVWGVMKRRGSLMLMSLFFCGVYLEKYTNRMFMSDGDTPGIRDACPRVFGFIFESFCLASIVIDFNVL